MGMFDPKVETVSTLTAGQRQMLDQLNAMLGGELGTGVEAYGGTVVPGMNPTLEAGLAAQGGLGGPGEDRALAAAMDPRLATDVSPERYTAGFDESYGAALEDYWNKYSKREIAHQYGTSGVGGNMADILAGSYGTNVAVPAAEARWGAHMRGIEAEQAGTETALSRALGAATSSADIERGRAESAVSAGETERGIEAEGLLEEYEKWATVQGYNNPWISQFLGPALGTGAVQNIGGASEYAQIAQMLGGVLGAAPL